MLDNLILAEKEWFPFVFYDIYILKNLFFIKMLFSDIKD